MTGAERGFLLLTSQLGDPARKPLTAHQFRELTQRAKNMTSRELNRDVSVQDFISIGYKDSFARHVVELLQDEELLEYYLLQAKRVDCDHNQGIEM